MKKVPPSDELLHKVKLIKHNKLLSSLISFYGQMVLVLDQDGIVLYTSDELRQYFAIDEHTNIIGLKPGDIINCSNAKNTLGGCGTTDKCKSCGLAIALKKVLLRGQDCAKGTCVIDEELTSKCDKLIFNIKVNNISIQSQSFIFISLDDISKEAQREYLDRTFFHDINNILGGLLGSIDLFVMSHHTDDITEGIHVQLLRLVQELDVHRCLLAEGMVNYQSITKELLITDFFQDLKNIYHNHSASVNKRISFTQPRSEDSIQIDYPLLLRVLCNMITNALEATKEGGEVRIWFEIKNTHFSFFVWEQEEIPTEAQGGIFTRDFTTKKGAGRGIGTYSMKLLAETILEGKVSFTTCKAVGTIFKVTIPKSPLKKVNNK